MEDNIETYVWLEGDEVEAFESETKQVKEKIDDLIETVALDDGHDWLVVAEALRRLAKDYEEMAYEKAEAMELDKFGIDYEVED